MGSTTKSNSVCETGWLLLMPIKWPRLLKSINIYVSFFFLQPLILSQRQTTWTQLSARTSALWDSDPFSLDRCLHLEFLESALTCLVFVEFGPWAGWRRSERYQRAIFLHAIRDKHSQLLVVTGPCSRRPHQVLSEDGCDEQLGTAAPSSPVSVCSPSVCNRETLLWSLDPSKEERAGSASLTLQKVDVLYVVLQFDLSLQGRRALYTKVYDKDMLGKNAVKALHLPSMNRSWSLVQLLLCHRGPASSREHLHVSHGEESGAGFLVSARESNSLRCRLLRVPAGHGRRGTTWVLVTSSKGALLLQLVLTVGSFQQQEPARETSAELSYTLPNVVPRHTYRARMRTQLSITCHERPHWSEWSKWSNDAGWCRLFNAWLSPSAEFLTSACVAGAVEAPGFRLNLLVIVLILLGLPMILLAVLLLARSQRYHWPMPQRIWDSRKYFPFQLIYSRRLFTVLHSWLHNKKYLHASACS